MRVMLSCPYSLTLFGGVQGQVLGLARALRANGIDARIVAPCDGPPPEPGITTVGPSTRVPSNGSVAPIATGRAVARRTIEALRTFRPDVLHLHEPLSPGPNHAALVGTTIPAVGTFDTECEILPNGVDVPLLAHGPVTPSDTPAIVFVGRHERRKGLAVLLDAFAGIERDAELWVIGDGPEQESLRARGVPRVRWLGRVTEDEKHAHLRG